MYYLQRLRSAVALLVMSMLCLVSFAQNGQVQGIVKDAIGEPMIGVSVVVKGTTNGTVTGLDGDFILSGVKKSDVITFTYIGYKNKEVTYNGEAQLNVTMEEDTEMLDEVVVIGYGTMSKRDLTGSIASVGAEELAAVPVNNVSEALTGKMPGVSITTTEGSPDAEVKIRVRGGGSLSQDNSPLYIVDGFPVSSISDIASADIESIDVLKDASSTAIYGAKGANGVIIITTKSGHEGKPQVNFGASFGIRKRVGEVGVLSPYEYVMYQQELNQDGTNYGLFQDLDIWKSIEGTNYQEELFGRTGNQQQYNVSVSGGTKETKYAVSYSRNDEKSIMIGSGYARNNITVKVQTKLNDWLTLDVNDRFSYTEIDGLSGGADTQESSKAYSIVARSTIYRPVTRLSEDFVDEDTGNTDYTPLERINATYKKQTRLQNNANASLTWEPIEGLKFRSEYGYGWRYNNTDQVWEAKATANSKFGYSGQPQAYLTKRIQKEWRLANTVTYDHKNLIAKEDKFNVMIGQEMTSSWYDDTNLTSVGFPTDNSVDDVLASMGNGTALPTETYIGIKDNTSSFFGRINYSLFDRYLLTATVRADGSSKFTDGNRWGVFPSVALAWRISEESFMKKTTDWLSNLKLRLSYGTAGNNRIDARYMYTTYALAGTDVRSIYFNETTASMLEHGTMLANPNLKWETTITRNIGIDFGFFNSRITGSIDAYWNTTKDLLMRQTLPGSSGYAYQYQNVGQTSNRGIEFMTDIVIADKEDWGLNFNFNISYNRGKIDKYPGGATWESSKWSGSGVISQEEFYLEEGGRLGEVYGYIYDGVYTTDDLQWNGTGWTIRTDAEGKPVTHGLGTVTGALEPGSMKLKDVNNDGTIDAKDKVRLGNTIQPVIGGFGLNGRFLKNFDFNIFFNYQLGGQIINGTKAASSFYDGSRQHYNVNNNFTMDNRWSRVDPVTGENMMNRNFANDYIAAHGEQAYYDYINGVNSGKSIYNPATVTGRPLTSWDVEDASFLRLQTISIGYTLPKAWTQKMLMQNVRIYATGYNLFCFTGYSGVDPEVDCCTSTPMTPGVDYAAYPKSFSIVGGINVTF
ncbi:MAG TPA: TonB-dependent receptor [Candidatus Phocaeicola merdavium]|nr:TonB-dependent receptor [Candidatus Phocaeicola merdavium]